MIVLVVLPFLLSIVVGRAAPLVARHCAPRWTTWALTALALCTALSTGLVLCVLAVLAVVETPWAGHAGHWSAGPLVAHLSVPVAVGIAAGLSAIVLAVAAAGHLVRFARHWQVSARLGRALGPGVDGLIVVEDERSRAYALPGVRGRTVVSTALLRRLDADERRAVLAHEAAHLRYRHFVYVQATELAAAANPLLRPVVPVVRRAVEAWADDEAVRAVGDRVTVARAVAKASLAHAGSMPAGALSVGSGGTDLAHRVGQLLTPRPARTGRVVAALTALAVTCATSAGVVGLVAHADFESAQRLTPG